MQRLLKDWGFALALGALVYLLVSWWQTRPPDLNGAAPLFSVTDLRGQSIDLAALHGTPVVLNFWASWCGPCKKEIPEFAKFAAENPDVMVVGAAVASGGHDDVQVAAKRLGITYPVVVAPDDMVEDYKVEVFPTTYIIDRDGQIRLAHVGVMDKGDLEAAVQ